MMDFDIAVVGAGPAGLCFARSLAGSGLSVALIERQPLAAIAEPAFDGREIALTHASQAILARLGLWDRFDPAEVSELRDARVINGASDSGLHVRASDGRSRPLGWLVPNHLIRRAAYEAVAPQANLALLAGRAVTAAVRGDDAVALTLDSGETLRARLLVAADSRFSGLRRMMGIGARSYDHGKRMLVCRVAIERPHGHVAWEWFGYGQTLALLPLNGDQASVVLTLGPQEMARVEAMDDAAFGAELERRFLGRLGGIRPLGTRHVYPLVSVFAERFAAPRVALVGDAAVGMHPVTAHGFNLGLQGQATLARGVLEAHRRGEEIGDAAVLARYGRRHQRAAWPMYAGTRLVVRVFTDDRAPVRGLREAILRVSNRVPPLRRAIAARLTQA
ncbi:5-demethoxyubiquinol-8 5-hydroxylase UbiM [Luteimonas composti]|uniref:5-demethoxyubiquinol-8 5-hydroxylase UbiM n=1 Tax=Luteimonas composti TaxID=398257 RepID=A0ABT6MM51_9GAMM|nr:5-demethoxyubiquinol-8 5-hydroxylase UbiM [Luteimonas composti]MDH7451503.1 5-demethoxyubiquinol-8 5-hydroxylase UbiM [Luteimonas composti]